MRTLKRKTFILGVGVQASGKATVLGRIAREVQDTVVLNRDTIINSFIWERGEGERETLVPYRKENGTIWSRDSEHYVKRVQLQSFHCLLTLGIDMLKQGKHPMLEGGYTKEIEFGYVEGVLLPALRKEFGDEVNVKIILTTASRAVIEKRISARGEPHDKDCLKKGWDAFWAAERVLPKNLENFPHIIVHTDKEIDWGSIFCFLAE